MNTEFNIPENWKVVTFEDVSEGKNAIVDGPFGSNLKTSDYIEDKVNGVPVLTTKNLEGDYSDDKVRFISKDKFETLKRSQVNPGDILVAKIGSIGKTGIYPKNARTAIIPANLLKFTVSKNVNFNYVFYYLNSRGLQNRIKNIATATAQPAFNVTKFRKLRIPLPPLPEQQAIVAKIEELLSDLENGKQQLQTAQQQLKVYRQSLLKWAFEGKLTNKKVKEGELPKGWKVVELKEVCEIKRGKSKHRPRNEPSLFGGKYPFIQTGDIRNANGGYIKKFSQTYSEMGLQQSKLWTKGTLCITIAANIGETAILGLDACFPDSVVGLVCNEKLLLNKYTNYFFISHKSKLEELAPATAQKNINVDILEKVKIPLPTLKEQQLIVDELESKLTVCDKIEETISQSLQQAETLRQSILKKAFEGKLVTQNPNDEPASKLLGRIKAESAKSEVKKKSPEGMT